ncbi:MAG: hypothetical protein ACYDEN_03845 [Acidimicrobiales bacterium]
MLSNHAAAQAMPASSFGASRGTFALVRAYPWPGAAQAKIVDGRCSLRTNATTPVGRPTSSPDRWTG